MDSIGKDCIELKRRYEACFNSWYSENFLKNKSGDISVCDPIFKEYQKCLKAKVSLRLPEFTLNHVWAFRHILHPYYLQTVLKVAIKKNNVPLWDLNGEMLNSDNSSNGES